MLFWREILLVVAVISVVYAGENQRYNYDKISDASDAVVSRDENGNRRFGLNFGRFQWPGWASELPELPKMPDIDLESMFGQGGGGRRKSVSDLWRQVFGENDDKSSSEEDDGPFGSIGSLFGRLRPWWKGANVCKREEEYEEKEPSSASNDQPTNGFTDMEGLQNAISSLMTVCNDYGSAFKCTMKVGRNGKTVIKSLIYECCHGYARGSNNRGCTEELELLSMMDSLRRSNYTTFATALQEADLDEKLNAGNFTVFAPDNQALEMPDEESEMDLVVIEEEPETESGEGAEAVGFVRRLLSNHIVDGWSLSHEWHDEQRLRTDDGLTLTVNHFQTGMFPFTTINCVRLESRDKQTTNGVIHQVEKMLPISGGTLWEMIQGADFSVFRSLISDQLKEQLEDVDSHLTVLPFTDSSFGKLDPDMQQRIRNNQSCLANLVNNHVLRHTLCSTALSHGTMVKSLTGERVKVTQVDGRLQFEGVNTTKLDTIASNGVIHMVDGPILHSDMLTTLETLKRMEAEQFGEILRQSNEEVDSGKTIFAPIDTEDGLADMDRSQIRGHIVDGLVSIEKRFRTKPQTVETVGGSKFLIVTERTGGPFWHRRSSTVTRIGCGVTVVKANVKSCNGIVHFIDKPLPKAPHSTLIEVLRGKEELSEFVTLLEMSAVAEKLTNSTGKKYTVLAPSNEKLNEMLTSDIKEKLLANREKFVRFMEGHILTEPVCCYSFGESGDNRRNFPFAFFNNRRHNNQLRTLAGSRLRSSEKSVEGATVVECDLEATNGLIHVIDRPLVGHRSSSGRRRHSTASRLVDLWRRHARGRGGSPFGFFPLG